MLIVINPHTNPINAYELAYALGQNNPSVVVVAVDKNVTANDMNTIVKERGYTDLFATLTANSIEAYQYILDNHKDHVIHIVIVSEMFSEEAELALSKADKIMMIEDGKVEEAKEKILKELRG